jgi:hypothetical protein
VLPYLFFGSSILLLFCVRIISFNNNILNHDELEWLYGIHRTNIDPRPFLGFDAHTSGPVSIYILSLINLFIAQPQTIHLRLFCFFFLIIPAMALLFWGRRNYLNYAALAFFTTLLSVNFQQFEWYFEDLFCYNTEFQILFFTALLYTLLVANPSRITVSVFSVLLILFIFVKIQVLFFVIFFGLAMLVKLAYIRANDLIILYLSTLFIFLTSILSFLWLTNTLKEAFYIYYEKNVIYQSNISGEGVDWFIVAKRIISSFVYKFRVNTIVLIGSLLALIYLKRIKLSEISGHFFVGRLFISLCLFVVSLFTILFSKNDFGHYYIVSFFPMAIFYSELHRQMFVVVSGKNKSIYLIVVSICLAVGYNYNYLGKSIRLITAKSKNCDKCKLGLPKGYEVNEQLVNWLIQHRRPGNNTILFLGWFKAQMLYYELGRAYNPVYRSANFFWYKSSYENKNWEFFRHEEDNLMTDLTTQPPFYIVDAEGMFSLIKETKFTRFVDNNYLLVQNNPDFKVYKRKN